MEYNLGLYRNEKCHKGDVKMGCKYWECKYNKIFQKGEIGDCGKPNGSNIRHSCPNNPNLNGDFCTDGEARDNEKIAEHH